MEIDVIEGLFSDVVYESYKDMPIKFLRQWAAGGDEGAQRELARRTGKQSVTKAGRNQIDLALSLLDSYADTKPGLITSPWPVIERPKLEDEQWRGSRITTVAITELHATQPYVSRERVQYYIKNPGAIEEHRRAFANVYDQGGKLAIVDGHHRLAALWLLGADDALVWMLRDEAE